MPNENGGAQKRNMIGMARLSCLPCRRRKSKCDREEPCSSCSLRNTERFCYTSEIEEDVIKTASTSHPIEKARHPSAGSSGDSPSSAGKNGQTFISGGSRPSKKVRLDDGEDRSKDRGADITNSVKSKSTTSQHKELIMKTIDSMEAALQSLRESIGLHSIVGQEGRRATVPSIAKWEDVSQLMPPKEDCELIVDYFFSETQWHSNIIHDGIFRKHWTNFMNGQAINRVYIAQACGMIALSLAFAPGYHAVSRLSIQSQHTLYCTLAFEILDPPSVILLDRTPLSIEDVQTRCLIISYMSFTGYIEASWQEVGKAVRLCKALQLYDEDKWNMRELSDWDIELRRRVAYEVCLSDRWLSLHHQRFSDLPAEFRTTLPSYHAFENFNVDTGRRKDAKNGTLLKNASWELGKYLLSCAADRVSRFLYNFLHLTPEQRYEEARKVDDFLNSVIDQFPSDLDYETAFKEGVNLSSPDNARLAAQALIGYLSGNRLRCTVMRQFLLDPKSPMDLRIAALEHARKIVEATPNLVTMSSNPWVSFSCAWCSGHLFCAASTFAIVYLGDSDQQDLQDLNWFASKIFEVIEALSFLSAKDPVAKRCEELLTALCTSKDWLRERFLASRSGKAANLRRKGSSSDSANFVAHQEDLSTAYKGNIPGLNPLLMNPSTYVMGGKVKESSNQEYRSISNSNENKTQAWNHSHLPTSMTNMVPSQAMITSPEAVSLLQNHVAQDKVGSTTTEPWVNWPLLNDQQWFSLLNTLEQDMSALAGNNSIQM